MHEMSWSRRGLFLAIFTLVSVPAFAQLNGENLLGDNGAKSGTQAGPGVYLGFLYYHYDSDTIKSKDGTVVTLSPSDPGSIGLNAYLPLVVYVSRVKILGANYGMIAAVPVADGALEAPGFGFQDTIGTGLADTYVVPVQLGWHAPRADAIAGFGFFAPTGRFTAGAPDNTGKGMWSFETSGGATVYFDQKKTISAATTAFWEVHTKKEGTGDVSVGPFMLPGVKVGQLLTLEGGLGKSFLEGAASVGVAYYAQYKLTHDEFDIPPDQLPGGPVIGKHRVWAFGPDVTVPIATKSKLLALVNVRYLWEAAARVKTQGQSLVVTATFPIPSIKITK